LRAERGAWELTTGDSTDADQTFDGITKIDVDRLRPITGSEPIAEIEKGDVLAIFLPQQMGYLLLEVKQ